MSYFHGLLYQPACHMCPLKHDRKVLPDGEIPSKLVILGEEPGASEVQQGFGFVGPSGKLLWHLAAAGGIRREECWVTNTWLCKAHPVDLATGAHLDIEQVKQIAFRCCRQRLLNELWYVTQNHKNAVIVPVGNFALKALSDRKGTGIFAYRGSVMECDLAALASAAGKGH